MIPKGKQLTSGSRGLTPVTDIEDVEGRSPDTAQGRSGDAAPRSLCDMIQT